jgi:hypothetical protein
MSKPETQTMPFDAQAPAEVTARDRMIQLRDFLETLPPEKFDMSKWGFCMHAEDMRHDCNTAACIGGWADAMFTDGDVLGSQRLGLTTLQERKLFLPAGYYHGSHTTAQAVAVLDHYLATGKIDWSVV